VHRSTLKVLAVAMVLLCCAQRAVAGDDAPTPSKLLLGLAPPTQDGPVIVHAGFRLDDINDIDDVSETVAFTGVLTLEWTDPRLAFEAGPDGDELVFQGNYQFNELSPAWYPQVVLVNEFDLFEQNGVVLRVEQDGRATLVQTIMARVETKMDMRWFPLDEQRLEVVFAVLGFGPEEVLLETTPRKATPQQIDRIALPQWRFTGADLSVQDRSQMHPGRPGAAAALVVVLEVSRDSVYVRRLVTFPLAVIVLLSFSVFWMDRSSLGDRISVSFIGILTAVTYQLVMWDVLPHISYFTLIHGFLSLSFVVMCATVVINLVVGAMDKRGESERGDLVDRRCRWIFPLAYFGAVFTLFGLGKVLF
jgi:hypothetical protein